MNFLNPFQQPAFGMDISDRSIKLAQLKRENNEINLIGYNRTEIPTGIISHGEISKEDELILIIKKSLENVRGKTIRTKSCIVSLPETEAFLRIAQLPIMTKEKLKDAIKWEAEANIPLPLSDIYLDWQIINKQPTYQNVLLGALPKKLVDSYLRVFKNSGLNPLIFEIESIATARALIKNNFNETPVLIVDLGSTRTNFIIFNQNSVIFTASLQLGNIILIEAIAKKMDINNEDAKNLKIIVGLNPKQKEAVFTAMEPHLNEIINKINECIDFYQERLSTNNHDKQISNIILCGGGANLIGLTDLITAKTQIETAIGNPWTNILTPDFKKIPELDYNESITYTTALGLALKGVNL